MSISVVIPCHNNGAHLAETLASVRAQTRQPLEVIVVDDASTDDSAAVVARFEEVRLLGLERNSGASLARNAGLFAARGEMVAWLDGDDIWEPNHLATVAGLLEKHPGAGLAFSLTRGFGISEKVWEPLLPQLEPTDAFWPSWRQTVAQMSTCVMWRDRLVALRGFDPTVRAVEDFEFFLRLAREHPFVCTHAITARYRKHSESASRQVVLARMQEYGVRKRFLNHAEKSESPEFVSRLEAEWRQAWETRLGEAWERRDLPLLRFYLGLQLLIPGAGPIETRWRRRARLAPLWGPWDAIRGRKRG
jgi:glycosyltransferase involved in cell wall biosynthesis